MSLSFTFTRACAPQLDLTTAVRINLITNQTIPYSYLASTSPLAMRFLKGGLLKRAVETTSSV